MVTSKRKEYSTTSPKNAMPENSAASESLQSAVDINRINMEIESEQVDYQESGKPDLRIEEE